MLFSATGFILPQIRTTPRHYSSAVLAFRFCLTLLSIHTSHHLQRSFTAAACFLLCCLGNSSHLKTANVSVFVHSGARSTNVLLKGLAVPCSEVRTWILCRCWFVCVSMCCGSTELLVILLVWIAWCDLQRDLGLLACHHSPTPPAKPPDSIILQLPPKPL